MTEVVRRGPPSAALAGHRAAVAELRRAYEAIPPGAPVRLAKRTSNLFRFRDANARPGDGSYAGLDVSAFDHVLSRRPGHQGCRRRRHDHLRGPLRRDPASTA